MRCVVVDVGSELMRTCARTACRVQVTSVTTAAVRVLVGRERCLSSVRSEGAGVS